MSRAGRRRDAEDFLAAGSSGETAARRLSSPRVKRKLVDQSMEPVVWVPGARPVPNIPRRARSKDLKAQMDATASEVMQLMLDVVLNRGHRWNTEHGPDFARELLKATAPRRKEITGAGGQSLLAEFFGQARMSPEPMDLDAEVSLTRLTGPGSEDGPADVIEGEALDVGEED